MIWTIKKEAAKQVADLGHNWIAWMLAGLGVTSMPFNQYLGGVLLSCMCASIIARHRQDPRKVWLMLMTAAVVATLVAATWPLPWVSAVLPVQVAMALSGLLSKWIVNFIILFFDRMETKGSDAADRIFDKVLPKDPDDRRDDP